MTRSRIFPLNSAPTQEYLSKFNGALLDCYANDRRVPVANLQEVIQLAGQFGEVDRIQVEREGPFTDALSLHSREEDFLPIIAVITVL